MAYPTRQPGASYGVSYAPAGCKLWRIIRASRVQAMVSYATRWHTAALGLWPTSWLPGCSTSGIEGSSSLNASWKEATCARVCGARVCGVRGRARLAWAWTCTVCVGGARARARARVRGRGRVAVRKGADLRRDDARVLLARPCVGEVARDKQEVRPQPVDVVDGELRWQGWCRAVQGGAGWCKVVQDGAGCCRVELRAA